MFSPEVIEKLQYYVYRLIDPRNGETFYVGKGKGNRLFAHVNDALEAEKWYKAEDVPERCMFDGEVAPDEIRQLFVHKRLPKKYTKKGMASPVLYHGKKI